MQKQLILRSTKSNLRALRKVLASRGALPRRLMIYVRQDQRRIWVKAEEFK